MTPELVSNQMRMDHLFEKHGGPFVINASLMGGKAVCVENGTAILEAQTVRQNDMDLVIQRVFSSDICVLHVHAFHMSA